MDGRVAAGVNEYVEGDARARHDAESPGGQPGEGVVEMADRKVAADDPGRILSAAQKRSDERRPCFHHTPPPSLGSALPLLSHHGAAQACPAHSPSLIPRDPEMGRTSHLEFSKLLL